MRGRRILLVDDEPDSQLLLSVLLKRAGASVTLADNGHAAQDIAIHEQAQGQPFDVILMDMNMPELDGYAAARSLRSSGYANRIVALTAASMADDRDLCLAAGCDDYLAKPVEMSRLVACICAV
ncbi:MAG: response regulator [Planctomycetota bacterium]